MRRPRHRITAITVRKFPYTLYLRCAPGTEPLNTSPHHPKTLYGPGRMNVVGHYTGYISMARNAMQHMRELHAPVSRWKDIFDWSRDW